jgi:hypothetical protein
MSYEALPLRSPVYVDPEDPALAGSDRTPLEQRLKEIVVPFGQIVGRRMSTMFWTAFGGPLEYLTRPVPTERARTAWIAALATGTVVALASLAPSPTTEPLPHEPTAPVPTGTTPAPAVSHDNILPFPSLS